MTTSIRPVVCPTLGIDQLPQYQIFISVQTGAYHIVVHHQGISMSWPIYKTGTLEDVKSEQDLFDGDLIRAISSAKTQIQFRLTSKTTQSHSDSEVPESENILDSIENRLLNAESPSLEYQNIYEDDSFHDLNPESRESFFTALLPLVCSWICTGKAYEPLGSRPVIFDKQDRSILVDIYNKARYG